MAAIILYVLPILITIVISGWRGTVFLAGGILLFTWIWMALSPGEVIPEAGWEPALTSFLVLVVAGLLVQQKHLTQQRDVDQAVLHDSEERYRGILLDARTVTA